VAVVLSSTTSATPYRGSPRSNGSPIMKGASQAALDVDKLISSLVIEKASVKGERKSPSLDEVLKAIEIGSGVRR